LEFRLKDGNSTGLSYALLDTASYDPSEGIRLRFGSQEVLIIGQHLNGIAGHGARLYEAILRHRVNWIRESGRGERMAARDTRPIVERIEFAT
jgi:hypothetical protein